MGEESLTCKQYASSRRTVYLEASINYARTFGRHSVGALFLYQHSQKNITDTTESDSDLLLPYRNQGIAGRITYDFDNRYFIEANFGYNGSENFSPKKRFGFFPSVAIGWAISEEKFFEPAKDVIDHLKFKASYGLVGNDQIGGNRRFIYNETIKNGGSYSFGMQNTSYTGLILGDWPQSERRLGDRPQTQCGYRPLAVRQGEDSGGLLQREAQRHILAGVVDSCNRGSGYQTVD